jgi:hypothetical protein
MTEEQLEHLIRASGAILNEDSILVIGSQSILPWLMKFASKNLENIPEVLVASTEADIIPVDNDPNKSDLIDGSIGEESMFHKTFHVYAQGVSIETTKAPVGWQSRCYPLVSARTNGVVGHCMHPADLFISKTIAGREKDGPFLDAMIQFGLVRRPTVIHLVGKVPGLTDGQIVDLRAQIEARFRLHGKGAGPGDAEGPRVDRTRGTNS